MLPFNQNMQNQSSSIPPRGPTPHHQQVNGAQSNMFPNLMQMQSQLGFMNPQLSNPFNNNNGNNLNNGFNGNRPPGMMNMPNFNALQQNPLLGSFQPGFCPQNFGQNQGFMGNGQLGNMSQGFGQNTGFIGNGQNMNQIGGVMLNPAQIAALSQLMGCVNQVAQGIVAPNGGFLGNSQLGLVQPNGVLQQQGNFGQQMPVGSQQLQNAPTMPFIAAPAVVQPQNNQSRNFQNNGNHGIQQGMHNSNARHNQKNFVKNPRREASNWRSPKSKTQHMNNGGTGSADHENSASQTNNEKRRPLFLHYTEKEIQKWREERKKNYPTKDNFQKKLSQKQANADAAAEDAKLRRQQLKEVLAKQAELGLEVPEIPSHYLLDNEDLSHGKGRYKRSLNNGRHQNKFNKRGRFDKTNRFPSKRNFQDNNSCGENEDIASTPKEENKNDWKTPIREPSLLQKLLTTDMKRDKNRLLQACRFMVMNSFFMDKTGEPLNFPKVIVEERRDDVDEESSLKELDSIIEAPVGCQEEGEITD